MKNYLFFVALLFSIGASAQAVQTSNQDGYDMNVSTNQRVHQGDSVQIQAILNTGLTKALSIKWATPSGIAINPINAWQGNGYEISSLWFYNLPPGVYPFTATGLSASGLTSTVADTLTILANPAARTMTSVSFPVLGLTVTLPATGMTVTYSDGSVIKQ